MRARIAIACADFGRRAIMFSFSRSSAAISRGFLGRPVRIPKYRFHKYTNVYLGLKSSLWHGIVVVRCAAMPRSSPFNRPLLRRGSRVTPACGKYTLPYFQVQRAKMILYAAEGMPNDEIAACLDTRREVVSLWRKRFFADRLPGWKNTLVRVAPGLFPQISSFRLKRWHVNCLPSTAAAVPLEHQRSGSTSPAERSGCLGQRQHAVALAA